MYRASCVAQLLFLPVSFDYRLCSGEKKRKYVENRGSGNPPIQYEAKCDVQTLTP